MKSQVSGCEEKGRLLQAYNDATREFSERVAAMNAKIGITQKKDYELIESHVECCPACRQETDRLAWRRTHG